MDRTTVGLVWSGTEGRLCFEQKLLFLLLLSKVCISMTFLFMCHVLYGLLILAFTELW